MEPALWQRSIKLLERVRDMPVQARGRTKVSTNLRVLPGRTEPRLYQFARNVPVEIVGRGVANWVQTTDEKDSGEPQENKREDWFLVRGIATRPPGETSSRAAEDRKSTRLNSSHLGISYAVFCLKKKKKKKKKPMTEAQSV